MLRLVVLCSPLVAFVVAGCGGEFESATVSGTVTCEGEPVPGGMLMFHPIVEGTTEAGPAAVAVISEDGAYSTEAVIGRLHVVYEPPDVADLEEEVEEGGGGEPEDAEDLEIARGALEIARRIAEMPCNTPSEDEVQVIAGENSIDFQLVYRDPREFD